MDQAPHSDRARGKCCLSFPTGHRNSERRIWDRRGIQRGGYGIEGEDRHPLKGDEMQEITSSSRLLNHLKDQQSYIFLLAFLLFSFKNSNISNNSLAKKKNSDVFAPPLLSVCPRTWNRQWAVLISQKGEKESKKYHSQVFMLLICESQRVGEGWSTTTAAVVTTPNSPCNI